MKEFFKFLKPSKKGLNEKSSQPTAEMLAQEFSQALQLSIPYHLEFGDVRVFSVNFSPEPRQPEFQDKLKEKIEDIVKKAKVTSQFATYVSTQLIMQHQMQICPSKDYSMRELVGIDLAKKDYGIFESPKRAKEIEGALLRKMDKGGLEMMAATDLAKINIGEWKKAFKKLRR